MLFHKYLFIRIIIIQYGIDESKQNWQLFWPIAYDILSFEIYVTLLKESERRI